VTLTDEPGLLTAVQLRTLRDLIQGETPRDGEALATAARARLEGALASMGVKGGRDPLWLSKGRLVQHDRCEGTFQAGLLGEGPQFEHSENTAAGALFHKIIEVDVGSRHEFDPRAVAERAATRLEAEDRSFAAHWASLDELDRFALVTEGTRRAEGFRASFPPLGPGGAAAPLPELKLRVELAGGAAVLSGKIDLLLMRQDPSGSRTPIRLALDLKTGTPRSEHAEDMRFYALLMALRYGVPPFRVATFFLESGEWQAEDVTGETLGHAVDRVLAAATTALELRAGREPSLTSGPWCGWCPRRESCPAAGALLSAAPPA
jgi:PD-(D/E)XK nuclease superfamily